MAQYYILQVKRLLIPTRPDYHAAIELIGKLEELSTKYGQEEVQIQASLLRAETLMRIKDHGEATVRISELLSKLETQYANTYGMYYLKA